MFGIKPSAEVLKNTILVLVSTTLSLIVCAVAAEYFLEYRYETWKSDYEKNGDWYGGMTAISDNPVLMWEYRPNTDSTGKGIPVIRTNRYGFRDVDYQTASKPVSTYRTAFVGDSVTLGFAVSAENSFVARFGEYANATSPDTTIQAMNFGVDGYNTVQIHENLVSKVLQFEPDKVTYIMCLNDFDLSDSSGEKARFFRKPDSFVLEILQKVYKRLRKIEFHVWHFENNKNLMFEKIEDMRAALTKRDIDFEVVILPIFNFEGSDSGFENYPLTDMHREIGEFLSEHEIDFVDLLDDFKNQKNPPVHYSSDIWHPNDEGHELIARMLLNH